MYELHPDRLVVEVADDGEGLRSRAARRRAALGDDELVEGGLGHRDHRGARRRARDLGSASRAARRCASSSCSRFAATRQRRPQVARRLRDARLARTDGRDAAAGRAACRADASCTSRRPPFGGGVAEINYTLVPLMADAGLDVEWRIIHGADEFFNVTKTIHNGLQGDPRGARARRSRGDLRPLQRGERRRVPRADATTS